MGRARHTNKVYFPNLTGLRFIAALLVLVQHVEQFKFLLGWENNGSVPFIRVAGQLGVVLFFVLSGFLITYLLLTEKELTQTISIRDFYVRRLLRIWPLYLLTVVLSFFLYPKIAFLSQGLLTSVLEVDTGQKLLLYLAFLPNLASVIYPAIPYAAQSWSVGVEEQFYLVWPILMKRAGKTFTLCLVILGYLALEHALQRLSRVPGASQALATAYNFVSLTTIDCMAIGGILASLLFREHRVLDLLLSRYTQATVYATLFVLLGLGVRFPYLHVEIYGALFGIAILNLAANKDCLINLEHPILDRLGKVSYGIYMFHPVAIVVSLRCLDHVGVRSTILQHILSLGLSVLLAGLSYATFESYFLKKKPIFSKVVSGADARGDRATG